VLTFFAIAADYAERISSDPGTLPAVQPETGGLSALGLNWQSFLFQLITFVIVLVILRVFVYKKLVATLDARQKAVEDSIKNAAETESKLAGAEKTIAGMITQARKEADDVLSAAHKEAAQMVEAAEAKAAKRAEHIVLEAKNQMDVEVAKVRDSLKKETLQLVAAATEHLIAEKLDATKDAKLIDAALHKAAKERA
jgi:F-type H+-transporting ATPase subunit b